MKGTVLVGLLYLGIGLVSAALAAAAATHSMQSSWRVSAFVVSALVFAVHLAHERIRLHHDARASAWHVAAAVAFGAFGLALSANIHDLSNASGYRPKMLIALVAWPLLTAVPAYAVTWGILAAVGGRRIRTISS